MLEMTSVAVGKYRAASLGFNIVKVRSCKWAAWRDSGGGSRAQNKLCSSTFLRAIYGFPRDFFFSQIIVVEPRRAADMKKVTERQVKLTLCLRNS